LCEIVLDHLSGSSNADLPTAYNALFDTFAAAGNKEIEAWEGMVSAYNAYRASGDSASFLQQCKTCAENVLITMWEAEDSDQYPLTSKTVEAALDLLIRYMEYNSETVDASEPSSKVLTNGPRFGSISGATQADPVVVTTIAAHGLSDRDVVTIRSVAGMTEINDTAYVVNVLTTTTFQLVGCDGSGYSAYTSGGKWFANDSNAELIVGLRDGEGRTLENALDEQIQVSASSTSTAGSESFNVNGEMTDATDPLSVYWTDGSNASGSISMLDPTDDNALSNGNFESFTTTDTPDDWTISVGAAGSTVKEESGANAYRGADEDDSTAMCLEIDSDGATLVTLTQAVTGMEAWTNYPVSCRLAVDVVPAAGTIVLELVDGNSSVINDEEGNANQLSINVATANTTFEAFTTTFRLPSPVPTTVTFRVRTSVAVSSGTSVFIDDVFLGTSEMEQLYDGGPYLAIVRGSTDAGEEDRWIADIHNAYGGRFQYWFRRLFDYPEKLLPSSTTGAETLADTIISATAVASPSASVSSSPSNTPSTSISSSPSASVSASPSSSPSASISASPSSSPSASVSTSVSTSPS